MLKAVLAAGFFLTVLHSTAFAACTKLSSKPDEASKIMSEMGDVTGTGTVTAETCTKLDALQVRANKL
jgi:hypothetical protein